MENSQISLRPPDNSSSARVSVLRNKIDTALEKLRKSRDRNRRKASFIKITNIILTGLATLLLGLQIGGMAEIQKGLEFALTGAATLLNALEPFFNYRTLWIEHEVAQCKLHRLEDEPDYFLARTDPETNDGESLTSFENRYLEVWDSLSERWIESRRRGGS